MKTIKELEARNKGNHGAYYEALKEVLGLIPNLKKKIAMIKNKQYYVFDENANWLLTKILKVIDKELKKRITG